MFKKKMSTKKALKLFVPIICVLLALMIAATVAMNAFSAYMDMWFGYGELVGSSAVRDENAKTDYYNGILDPSLYASKEAAYANAAVVNEEIVLEGIVLLKNEENALPLSKSSAITLLGANNGYTEALTSTFASVLDKQVTKINSGLLEDSWDEAADYSANKDAAIVTIYRSYGEGNDADLIAADGIRTELSLSKAELEVLDNACKTFDEVIVLVASSNAIELGFLTQGADYVDPHYGTAYDFSNVKGALWLSTDIGNDGAKALAKILTGDVNPSGRMADTSVINHKLDPTYVNNGTNVYANGDLGTNGYKCNGLSAGQYSQTTFVDLEEGIYFGYKYYETAAYEAMNGNYDGFVYEDQVAYPFGYGLSYTTFTAEYEGTPSFDGDTNEFTFKVKVTNTGSVAGKYVAQIYANAPYYDGEIEKAHVVLVGFAKTDVLEPGKSETLTITANRDYITSYDYKTEKCYVLDEGDYNFYLLDNAHAWTDVADGDSAKVWTYTLSDRIVYNGENARPTDKTTATNTMDDETNWKFTDEPQTGTGLNVNFSRSNFKATFPTAPVGDDYIAQDKIIEDRTKFDSSVMNDIEVDDFVITGSLATSYVLADMRGLDFDDPKWDEYIQQLSLDTLVQMYATGNWQTIADPDNGVPRGIDLDGPEGLSAIALDTGDAYHYMTDVLLASTWNVDKAYDMGTAVAYEFMAYGFTGWYGPGNNIHRSAFCGRNGQYYSEDVVLAGKMAATEVSACSDGGMICYLKHFALNVLEDTRDANLCTWVNEQALRESYLRAWEIYMKEASMNLQYYGYDEDGNEVLMTKQMPGATGVMTAYNLVGATWIGSNKAIMVDIVREEFGFTGIYLTDAINNNTEYMDATKGLWSGGTNLCLSQQVIDNYDNDYAILQLQKACKYILYNKANSNVLELNNLFPGQVFTYGDSPWRTGLNVAWVIAGVIVAASGACLALVIIKNNKNKKGER